MRTYQKISMIIIGLICTSIFIVGCKSRVNNVKTSDLINYKNEKILKDTNDGLGATVVQNSEYIFYIRTNMTLVKVDKKSKKKEVILKLKGKNIDNSGTRLNLYHNTIYYTHHDAVYSCDFNGNNTKKITSIDEFKNALDESKNILGIQVYNDKIYLELSNFVIIQLDTDTNKMNIVAKENTEKGYFFKNNYYYINAERTNINRVNLSTLKVTSVRGKKGKSKLYYDKLFISDKKMFYAVSSGKGASRGEAPSKIYSYEEGNKDKKIYTASINMMDSVCGNQNIGIVDFGIKKNEIIIYNVKTDKKESHQIPNEVAQVYMMMGNLIFCNDSAESDAYRIVRL